MRGCRPISQLPRPSPTPSHASRQVAACGVTSGFVLAQMTMVVPAAVAMRAAVSLVTMPPVPHCVPLLDVSAVSRVMSSTTWMGVALGSIWGRGG